MSDKALVPESNIIINFYVNKKKVDSTEKIEIIPVDGEVIWVKHLPDVPSKMGIRFKESNEELVRIYVAKNPSLRL